jgi:hypothetical protein
MDTQRLIFLQDSLQCLDEEKKVVLMPLLTDIVFMESKLYRLREMEHIRVHPADPTRQETTAAGKQYKETMQAYLNAVKLLLMALYRAGGSSAADELLQKLQEFEE